jgi:hypothetical protein
MPSRHLRPLVTALVEGIGDDYAARGTGLVLVSVL